MQICFLANNITYSATQLVESAVCDRATGLLQHHFPAQHGEHLRTGNYGNTPHHVSYFFTSSFLIAILSSWWLFWDNQIEENEFSDVLSEADLKFLEKKKK